MKRVAKVLALREGAGESGLKVGRAIVAALVVPIKIQLGGCFT
jgi:hypothetical protein